MAESSVHGNLAASYVPVFKGEGYEHWSLRMKTILRARELWDVVFLGVTAIGDGSQDQRESKKKDTQAMTIIQQGVHDSLFSRIATAESAKNTWDILQIEYQGDSQVQSIKLQGLRRNFENLSMKDDENIGDYFSRVMNNVGQQRSYGEELTYQKIVEKVLRSLSPKFDYVIPSIEVVYDLAEVTPVKLMRLLKSQEERINSRTVVDKTVKAPERQDEQVLNEDDGEVHVQEDEQHLLLAATTPQELLSDDPMMLMANGSNFRYKDSFIDLDESFKLDVRLGDRKKLAVEGKGTVKIRTGNNGFKLLSQVYYAPKLEYNLLSVGKLMKKWYNLLFDSGKCIIKHKENGKTLLEITVATNNMFVFDAKV
ncbi:uncharacterized protein LOC143582186 [Bidens hawaiensis]|uniref:uncharacterized protein LOC143582186 n=1 Tax=Bidens hawaiensis TaxID=980011 RepID=UPI00404B5EC2